jgi:hypothetical protein
MLINFYQKSLEQTNKVAYMSEMLVTNKKAQVLISSQFYERNLQS